MIINKISQKNDLFISAKIIHDFGVSFNVSHRFNAPDGDTVKLYISYKIKLFENMNQLIGVIHVEYEFILDSLFYKLDDSQIATEETIVRNCLKSNHYNIRDLVENVLECHQIKIQKDYIKLMN